MRLLISDANILIDIEDGGLAEALFQLPYSFMTPDMLFLDELDGDHGHLLECGLQLGELEPAAVAESERLAECYRGPSRYDCLALALAKQENCPQNRCAALPA